MVLLPPIYKFSKQQTVNLLSQTDEHTTRGVNSIRNSIINAEGNVCTLYTSVCSWILHPTEISDCVVFAVCAAGYPNDTDSCVLCGEIQINTQKVTSGNTTT